MIKPDAYNRGVAADVERDVLSKLERYGLKIEVRSTKILSVEEVCQIYPNIDEKSFVDDFLKLMTSNYSTTFIFSGENATEKAKTIRGSQKTNSDDEPLGIRGRYCYVADASEDDLRKLKENRHPNREQLIAAIIGGVIHASDTVEEIVTISKVFKISLEK